ncbi:MAG: bacterio-opsin activator domain-containing protein [archaeon]
MAEEEPPPVDFEVKERAMDEAPIGITISDPDQPDNPLVYINDAFERLSGYPSEEVLGRNCRFLQGDDSDPDAVGRLREGIDEAEPVTVELLNYRRDGEPFWNEVTVAPLRDETGTVSQYVGFQVDVTRRKEAQLALAEEREHLDRLVDRINGLLADVTELLIHSVDPEATEQAIVERIAATDAYAAAWIGEPNLARDVLVTSSSAGFGESVEDHEFELDGDSPAVRAYREATVTVTDGREGSIHPVEGAPNQLAAVPLVYGNANYGVLMVVSVEENALNERELVVLESIGRTIATAINAAQSRRGLTTDDLVELEFTVTDSSFFPLALVETLDGRLELRGSTASDAGGLRLFFDVVGNSKRLDTLPDLEAMPELTHIPTSGSELLECEVEAGSFINRLAERGAEVRSLTVEPGVAELEIHMPAETGGRVVLELLDDRYDGVELVAYRDRERRPTTRTAFVAELESELTERQATALRIAYYSGYYDEHRTNTGNQLAEAMGVSRQTFHQHLRAAERKLVSGVLD